MRPQTHNVSSPLYTVSFIKSSAASRARTFSSSGLIWVELCKATQFARVTRTCPTNAFCAIGIVASTPSTTKGRLILASPPNSLLRVTINSAGLKINSGKRKTTDFGQRSIVHKITLNGTQIQIVEEFASLSSLICSA